MGNTDHPLAPDPGPSLCSQLLAGIQSEAFVSRRWRMPDIAARPDMVEVHGVPFVNKTEQQRASFKRSRALKRVFENRETLMIHPQQRWQERLLTDTLCARCKGTLPSQ